VLFTRNGEGSVIIYRLHWSNHLVCLRNKLQYIDHVLDNYQLEKCYKITDLGHHTWVAATS
jgi:UDP-N-acetylglucosamine transferase subunit ALG13